jgi:hypothetical protein
MKVFEYLDRFSLMQRLLEGRCTGTPEEFAGKLGISRTSLYETIDELKSRGAPIAYSKSIKTFYYTEPFEISISCCLRPMTFQEEKEYTGGTIFSRILFFRTLGSEISNVSLLC